MALENMKSMYGGVIRPRDCDSFNVYGHVPQPNRNINKKPISQIVMSGGYIPGNNYGDNVGVDEI